MRRLTLLAMVASVVLLPACGSDDRGVRAADAANSTTNAAAADVESPKLGDHWHIAVGFSACGAELPRLEDAGPDSTGIHTHGDGLIHVHPFATSVAGRHAVLGVFFDTVGARVTDEGLETSSWKLPFKGDCGGSPAAMRVMTWTGRNAAAGAGTTITSGQQLRSIPLRPDGSALAIALVPEGAEIPMPASVSQLAAPSDVTPAPPTGRGQGTPTDAAFGFASVLGTGQPPCDDTATPSHDALQCYELAPVTLGPQVIAKAEAEDNNDEWTVHLELTDVGINAFNNLASTCFDKSPKCPTGMLATIIDGVVISAPTVQTPSFEKDRIQISGGFTEKEARALAETLSP